VCGFCKGPVELELGFGILRCVCGMREKKKQDLGNGQFETKFVWAKCVGKDGRMGWECGVNRSYFLTVAKEILSYFRGMIAMSRCDGSARMEPHEWLDAMSHLI
jgi:hypothetical protein